MTVTLGLAEFDGWRGWQAEQHHANRRVATFVLDLSVQNEMAMVFHGVDQDG
jgi:hypothetical protein